MLARALHRPIEVLCRSAAKDTVAFVLLALSCATAWPGDLPGPPTLELAVTNRQATIQISPYPGAETYRIQSTPTAGAPFTDDFGGILAGYTWTNTGADSRHFFRLAVDPLSPERLLTSIVLNRLANGPTPDDLERVLTGPGAIGPESYIEEQLAPEKITESIDISPRTAGWQFVSFTGAASSSTLLIYLDSVGDVYLDDLELVAGTEARSGQNLVTDGDFESPLSGRWAVPATNLVGSTIAAGTAHSGESSLHLVSTGIGTGVLNASISQIVSPALQIGQIYTLSYWYLPSTNGSTMVIRLGAGGGITNAIVSTQSLMPTALQVGALHDKLTNEVAGLEDFRAWHTLHAVRARRQFLEVLTQFVDNHFTTEWQKSHDYISGLITNDTTVSQVATSFEFREQAKWRSLLLDPNTTFYDLLRVSAESPAMIIYLDTATSSAGNANENYSRELMELFTLGVDNGYDQGDIVEMARAWTGWRADKLPLGQENNPYATPGVDRNSYDGYWTLRFRTNRHDYTSKSIFAGKTIDSRFGPPRAGQSYQLYLPVRPLNQGMQDGYAIIRLLADLPYAEEFISVKLCRLLVHENFQHGVYDYSHPESLSPEGLLVKACIDAWESPGPDGRTGNLRQVLRTILGSRLFRQQTAAQQKIKSPFRFIASTVRALRAVKPDGTFLADTDGYAVSTTMKRLNMALFNRIEPDGYSEFGRDWINTAALIERMRFAQNFLMTVKDPLKTKEVGSRGKNNVSDPVGLLKLKLPPDQMRDPAAVVDYFLGLFFPAEGKANLDLDRTRAITFLSMNDAGTPDASPFATLDPASTAYDVRVRSMVGMLLSLPRFQEM